MAITKAQFAEHIALIVNSTVSPGHLKNEITEYVYAVYGQNGASVPDANLAAALAARNAVKGNTSH